MECVLCYAHKNDCHLACGHSFCYQCVKRWYQESYECPLCRAFMIVRKPSLDVQTARHTLLSQLKDIKNVLRHYEECTFRETL